MLAVSETWIEEKTCFKLYLHSDEDRIRWVIKDQRKAPYYQILYNQTEVTMQTINELVTSTQLDDLLDSLDQSIDFKVGNSDENYTLECRQITNWELAVITKHSLTTYHLTRESDGWNVTKGTDLIAKMRGKHGETKIGTVQFNRRVSMSDSAGILLSLAHAITTASVRFFKLTGIPASNENDSIEKYHNLDHYRTSESDPSCLTSPINFPLQNAIMRKISSLSTTSS